MLSKDLPWAEAPVEERSAREVAAALLRAMGAALDTLATRLTLTPAVPAAPAEPRFEFYAEAGAPEGALYVDGRLVGHLPGVQRL